LVIFPSFPSLSFSFFVLFKNNTLLNPNPSDLVNVVEVFLPQLLMYPNPTDPLNGEAASLHMRDQETYVKKVKGQPPLLFPLFQKNQNRTEHRNKHTNKQTEYVAKYATEQGAEDAQESESASEMSSIESFSDDEAPGMEI